MKKILLTSITILTGILSYGQCIDAPACLNQVILTCNDISNQSINGSPCFKGKGDIPTSYNINNATFYTFDGGGTDSVINVYQNINLQYNQKVFIKSGKVRFYGNLSMVGSDTIVCYENTETVVTHLIANNSKNIFILYGNASLKVGPNLSNTTSYYPGDTIHTVPGNSSNDVRVITCNNIPLAVTIAQFKLYHNTLYWKVIGSDNIEVQYSEDSKNYNTIRFNLAGRDSLEIKEAGFYQLKVGGKYSKPIMYDLKVLEPATDNKIYYYEGKWYLKRPNVPVVGVKYKK